MLNKFSRAFIILLTFHSLSQECVESLSIIATCQGGQFQCQADDRCISDQLVCDGNTDCVDQSDEWNCTSLICSENEFRCKITGHCIEKKLTCDGSSDCIDNSDEERCTGNSKNTLAVEAYPCEWNQFHCGKDSKCIPFFRWCDHFEDCSDGSDEHDCNQRKIVAKSTYSYPCKEGEFFCGEDLKCIPMILWCDHFEDCSDGSDELYCDRFLSAKANTTSNITDAAPPKYHYVCNQNQFACKQDGKCILESLRCDHTNDCSDGSDEKCCDQVCGRIKASSALAKLVGGKPAAPKDWPWMAALIRKDKNRPFCGGTLISDIHVLTAAHCLPVNILKNVKVRLGEYNFANDSDNNPQDFEIEEIRTHELFDGMTNENDIAIIKLSRPATFSEFIGPACLPPHKEMFENRLGRVAGWGANRYFGKTNDVLHDIVIKAWEQRDCVRSYIGKTVSDDMMCGGWPQGGLDSCQGDSGGPFVMHTPVSVRWFVAGIVSWGEGCAQKNKPGVYSRVNYYLDWISKNMLPGKVLDGGEVPGPREPTHPKKRPFDCSDVCTQSENCKSGVYTIYPIEEQAVEVWCDMDTSGGKWTILVNRKKLPKQVSFQRNWNSYKNGFGTADTEYWIGNEIMHQLTKSKNFTLRIEAVSKELGRTWGEFRTFIVSSEWLKYKLRLEAPTAGNIVYYGKDGLELHDGLKFTTRDSDNDESPRGNCGDLYGAGMWYARCYNFHPTGIYGIKENVGIKFESWSKEYPTIGYADSLQFKIRPSRFQPDGFI